MKRLAYVPEGPFKARSSFRYNGKDYGPGDSFPWRKLGVTELLRRQMWKAHMLDVVPVPAKVEEAK